jgi:DNA-binding transcriptional ArsR family regulator
MEESVEAIAAVLQALALPLRLRIVLEILDQESTVTEIGDRLNIASPTLAQHLRHLRVAGIVQRRRVGNHVRYTVAPLGKVLVRAIIAGIQSGLPPGTAAPGGPRPRQ